MSPTDPATALPADEPLHLLHLQNQRLQQQVNQHALWSQEQADRDRILYSTALHIRESLELNTILTTTVEAVQHLLQTDRVLIYQFEPDGGGRAVVEAVSRPEWSILGQLVRDECFEEQWLRPYQERQSKAIADIYTADLSPCHVAFLQQLQVRANLVVPILVQQSLWGLLILHHCTAPYPWPPEAVDFVSQLSVQLAIAIQQALLLKQVQASNAALQASEVTKHALIRAIPDLLIHLRQDGTYLKVINPEQVNFLTIDGVIEGKTIFEVMPTEVAQRRLDCIHQALQTGEMQIHEYQLQIEGRAYHEESRIVPLNQDEVLVVVRDVTDRKRAEAELQLSESQLNAFFSTSKVGMGILDHQLRYLKVNHLLAEPSGLAAADHLGCSLYEVTPTLAEQMGPLLRQVVETGKPILNVEISSRTDLNPDQARHWTVSCFPLRLAAGQQSGVGCVLIETTDRKRTEQALSASETRFEAFMQNIPACTWIVNAEGRLLYGNQQFLARLNCPPAQALHQHLDDVLPQDQARQYLAHNQRVLESQHSLQTVEQMGQPDGSVGTLLVYQFPFQSEAQAHLVGGVSIDISDRIRTEEALAQQFRQSLLLRQITDEIRRNLDPQEIFQTAAQQVGQAFQANRCLIHLYSADEVPRMPLAAEFLMGDYPSMQGVEILLEENRHVQQVLSQEKAVVSVDVLAEPLLQGMEQVCQQASLKSMLAVGTFYQGKPNGIIGLHQCDRIRTWTTAEINLLESIAAQVGIALAHANLLEREIQRSQELTQKNFALAKAKREAESASRAKSEFLANMSHEIRTPMNAILGFTDLLSKAILEPQAKGYLAAIAASGKTLLALINDILDLSKIEAGKFDLHYEPVNLRGLVREIQQIFSQKATEKGLDLLIQIDESVPAGICIDDVRLRQILFNVVGNALKFTEVGQIEIQVRGQAYTQAGAPRYWLELAVSDTGIGIGREEQQTIFQAFVQSSGQSIRKYGGTGLGLAITQRLTHMMGGTIFLQSALGQGSTFNFVFPEVKPVSLPTTAPFPSPPQEDLRQFPPVTLLVIDDIAANRDLIQGYFADTAHRVLLAADGETGLHLARTESPDLILLDLKMPGLDGCSVAYQLKQDPQTQAIPIVLFTASSQQPDLNQADQLFQGVLQKPASRDQLASLLRQLLPPQADTQPAGADSPARQPVPSPPPLRQVLDKAALLNKLQQEEATHWAALHKTLRTTDLEDFVQRLQQWAEAHQWATLERYAETLQTQLESFDWEKIPATVASFPTLLSALHSTDSSE